MNPMIYFFGGLTVIGLLAIVIEAVSKPPRSVFLVVSSVLTIGAAAGVAWVYGLF